MIHIILIFIYFEGHVIQVNRLPFRILIGSWVLVATVLVNSYSGTVISYITVPKMKSPINTFEDLVASSDVNLILLADTITKKQTLANYKFLLFHTVFHATIFVF